MRKVINAKISRGILRYIFTFQNSYTFPFCFRLSTFAYFGFRSISNSLPRLVRVRIRLGRTNVQSDMLFCCLLTLGGDDVTPDCFSTELVEVAENDTD